MFAPPLVAPLLASLIAVACAAVVALDARRRPAPDKVAWLIAFALFAVAAGSEVAGAIAGWSAPLARLYYLSGAVLVVGFLALGELFLLAPRRTRRLGPGVMLLITALALTLVLDAPIDGGRLAAEGWRALERGPALVALAVGVNAGGSAILVGGALLSAWRFWRGRTFRHRMIGCLLIAVGTLIVASGGTLTRSGRPESLYLAMGVGIGLIFAGYLEARRRDEKATTGTPVSAWPVPVAGRIAEQEQPSEVGPVPRSPAINPGVEFIEESFLPLPPEAVARLCDEWSVVARDVDRLDRDGARRVWALRLLLAPEQRGAFDRLPVPTRWQLAELYDEILAPAAAVEFPPARLPSVATRREGVG